MLRYLIPILAAVAAAAAILYRRVMWPLPLVSGNGPRRIACVGDSITYSLGVLGRRPSCSYPALLARELGPAYTVTNFGLSDRALAATSDKPYFAEKRGRAAWDAEAEVVVFMLGSNDCKRHNWNAAQFRADYEAAICHYQAAGCRLLLLVPPRIFYDKPSREGYDNTILESQLLPLVRALAEAHQVPCLDLYALTADHPAWFPDRLHPNRAGNAAIARAVADALRDAYRL